MSVTEEIPEGYYTLQLVSTDPFQPTSLYAADNGIGNQILLGPGGNVDVEAWAISPVKMEPNTYLITKNIPTQDTPGFMPDTKLDKVLLDVPKKWFFYRVEGPDVPPNVYSINPVDVPDITGAGFFLGGNATKDAVIVVSVPLYENSPPGPAWQLIRLPIDAK